VFTTSGTYPWSFVIQMKPEVFTTSGTYPLSFVTQIFYNG